MTYMDIFVKWHSMACDIFTNVLNFTIPLYFFIFLFYTLIMIKVDSKLRNKNIVKNGGRLYVTKSNSEEFMDEVVGMYNDGAPVTEIADRLGVAKATIYRIIKERS